MEAEQLVSFHLLALHYPLAPYGRVRLVSSKRGASRPTDYGTLEGPENPSERTAR
jgi:hypothetical protein